MARAYVGLGSNLDHPRRQLARAIAALHRLPRTRVAAVSPNYLTAPQGSTQPQPDYVNGVVALDTALPPRALLQALLRIEQKQRRVRMPGQRNAPRTLDLDLLLFGGRRMRTRVLSLPHPRMHVRAFVLRPLSDLSPFVRIPGHGPARRLLRSVADQRVRRTRSHPPMR